LVLKGLLLKQNGVLRENDGKQHGHYNVTLHYNHTYTYVDPRAAELAAGRKNYSAKPAEKLRLAVSRAGKEMRLSRRKMSG